MCGGGLTKCQNQCVDTQKARRSAGGCGKVAGSARSAWRAPARIAIRPSKTAARTAGSRPTATAADKPGFCGIRPGLVEPGRDRGARQIGSAQLQRKGGFVRRRRSRALRRRTPRRARATRRTTLARSESASSPKRSQKIPSIARGVSSKRSSCALTVASSRIGARAPSARASAPSR